MPAYNEPDINISEELESEISDWLYREIKANQRERTPWIDLWEEIEEYRDKTELDEKKDFPFEGAAHLMIPLMPMFSETIKAKILNTIFAPSDPFATKPTRKEFIPFAKPIRKFLTWAADNELDLEEVMDTVLSEFLDLGATPVKVVYTLEEEMVTQWNEAIEEFETVPVIKKDHPEIIHFQIQDYFFPLSVHRREDAPWQAHRYRRTWNDLVRGERQGKYNDIERIKAWQENTQNQHDRVTVEGQEIFVEELEEYELYDVWFEYPLKEGDAPTKMVWQFHLESRTPLRMQHNWYPLQLDPFEVLVYEKKAHRVLGMGIGQMTLPFQKEVSTMHNQRLDSVSIKNAPMFKYKANSSIPGEIKFRVGGGIPVDEMDDIDVLFSGQTYDSTIESEEHTLNLLRERIGIQDFMGHDMIANAQSTSVLAAMAEGTRRFDLTIKRVRRFLSRVMTKVLLLYQKYYPEGKPMLVQGQDGQMTEVLFSFPEKWITEGLGVDVTATTSTTSKELERQNKLSLFGMITQYYGQLTQYLLQAENPQLPVTVRMAMYQIVDSLSTFVLDVLEDFELSRAGELAIRIEELQALAQQGQAQGGGQAPPGQPGMAGPGGPPPGAPGTPGQ